MRSLKKIVLSRILGIILSLSFIIITIGILILAQGKRISKNGEILESSIIRINSAPKDVKAFINDKEVQITENQIINLDPIVINIKLTKKGYTPWEKQVSLKSGIVTDVYAQLYPENIKFQTLTSVNINKVFYSQDSTYAFYTVLDSQSSSINGIWKIKLNRGVLDFNENKPISIYSFDLDLSNTLKISNYTIKIARDNNKIILYIPDKNILELYDSNSNNSKIDIYNKLGFMPSDLAWFRDSSSIILVKEKVLIELDLNSYEMTLISFNTIPNINFVIDSNNCIYFKDNKLYKYSNKVSSNIVLSPYMISILGNILSIESFQADLNIMIIKSVNGLYYVDLNKGYVDLIDSKGDFINLSQTGRSLLFVKDMNYYSYNLEETLDGKSFLPIIYNLNLNKAVIKNIYFSPSAKSLIILQNSQTTTNPVKLVVMDYDGGNKQILLSDFKIIDDKTLISNNSTEIYVLVEDKQSKESSFNNIYKFNLEVK